MEARNLLGIPYAERYLTVHRGRLTQYPDSPAHVDDPMITEGASARDPEVMTTHVGERFDIGGVKGYGLYGAH
eukprot:3473066-Prymnesium_polylepis.2